MINTIAESDWKRVQKLKTQALDRFCRRILDEIAAASADSKPFHARYIDVYALVQQRDEQIANTFNDLRRSTAIISLASMRSLGLITDEELAGFTIETQAILDRIANLDS